MSAVEHQHFVIPVDENVQKEIERLLNEGWTPVPGVTPLAVYHMQRVAGAGLATASVKTGMTIDDAGITIIRGDGTLVQ